MDISLIAFLLIGFVLGAVIGAFITHYFYKKQIKEWQKKMEIPDKEQVRNMLSALGQKPSEQQVNRFINTIKKQETKKKPTKNSKKKNKK
jgi:uncharacterized protein YneF (UPF0154 family)